MANNALALRMKYRKFTAEQLNDIIENENSSELEVKVAQEFLDKLGGEAEENLKRLLLPRKPHRRRKTKRFLRKRLLLRRRKPLMTTQTLRMVRLKQQ